MADEQKPDDKPNPDGGVTTVVGKEAPPERKKITFDAEQQPFVQELIDGMFGKGFARAKGEFEPKLSEAAAKVDALTKELEALRAAAKPVQTEAKAKDEDGGKGKDKPADKPSERETQLQAKLQELEQGVELFKAKSTTLAQQLEEANRATSSARMRDEFLKALPAGIKFVDINDAFDLAMREGMLRQDDKGNLVVIDPATNEAKRVKATFEVMTAADYIADFAARKPHLVEDTTGGGTGAGASTVVRQEKAKSWKDMPREEFRQFVETTKSSA